MIFDSIYKIRENFRKSVSGLDFLNMSNCFKFTFVNYVTAETNLKDNLNCRNIPFSSSKVFLVPIISYELLTKGKDVKKVYDLKLSLEGVSHDFLPGDTIGILPSNDREEVNALLDRLNIKAYAEKFYKIDISPNIANKKSLLKHIPTNGLLIDLFMHYIDIRTPPKKIFLKALRKFTTDNDEIQELEEVSAAKSAQKYIDLITGSGRTLLGLLKTFPSCFPSMEVILQYSQPLQPRVFSISSSPLSEYLGITFFIVNNPDGTKGVCTGYLEKCIEHDSKDVKIPIYFRNPTKFRVSDNLFQHLILIAAGTGIAPFMAFLQHRSLMNISPNCGFGDVIFYYGCRYTDRDFLYKNIVDCYLQMGIIRKMYNAFSRENKKCYIQDKINESGMELVDYLMNKDTVIYICGQSKTMVEDVKAAIANNLAIYGKTEKTGTDLITSLIDNHKIIIDIWNT